MRRHSTGLWAIAGLASGWLGWILGGLLLGSLMGRTTGAATLVALAFGGLTRGWRFAAVIAVVSGALSCGTYILGQHSVTPLVAWPATGLLVGAATALMLDRTGPRVTAIIAAPVLGVIGFVAGTILVMVAGFGLNAARVLEQLFAGGAVGFGLVMLGGLRILSHWLDRLPSPAGGAQ